MQQVLIAARRRDNRQVIAALQNAGVLHLTPMEGGPLATGALTGEEGEARKAAERLYARAESTLSELGARRAELPTPPPRGRWEELVEAAAEPASRLSKRMADLRADLDAGAAYADVSRTLANLAGGLDRSKRLALLPFVLPAGENTSELQSALNADLQDRYALDTAPTGGNVTAGIVAVLSEDYPRARAALARARLGELRLPGRFDGMRLSEAAATLARVQEGGRAQLNELEEGRRALGERHAPELYAVRDALADELALYDVQTLAARGKYSMVLRGYVPDDRVPVLRGALDGFGDAVSYELTPADAHHGEDVPVELKNEGYFKRMQPLMSLFPPPRYGTFDPTPIIGAFFPFFFGFVIADIAYGLLILWLGFALSNMARRQQPLNIGLMGVSIPPVTLTDLGYIVKWMAFWSIVWGFATGEFFGTLLEHLHVFYIPGSAELAEGNNTGALIPIVFPRLETSFVGTVLVVSLFFGIVQVVWAWLIRIRITARLREPQHMWEAVGMLGGLIGLIALSYVYLQAGFGALVNFGDPVIASVNVVMYLGFVVFLLGLALSRVPMMILEIISNGGALLSYSRLFAVGLASAVLARLATDSGWSLYESYGVLGAILGLIVSLLIHALAVLFTIIGHVLQPLRLNYVEFLTRTGFYEGASPRYAPFRRLSPDR